MISPRWFVFPLFFFLVTAVAGVTLRTIQAFGFPGLDFEFLVHAHSHTAFQAWVYPALFILIVHRYLSPEQQLRGRYKLQLIITLIILTALFPAFLLQGYGSVSIPLSTLFQLLNYLFIFSVLKDTRLYPAGPAKSFLWVALFSYLISTFGPWTLAALMAQGHKTGIAYEAAVYFFLHFQFAGAFTFCILALLLRQFEIKGLVYNRKWAEKGFFYLTLGLIPSWFLNLGAHELGIWPNLIGMTGNFLSLLGLVYFTRSIGKAIENEGRMQKIALFFFIAMLFARLVLGFFAGLEPLSWVFHNRLAVIFWLHLHLIGFVSFALLFLIINNGGLSFHLFSLKMGLILVLGGFILSEALLGFWSLGWGFKGILGFNLFFSVIMAFGLVSILISALVSPKFSQNE